MRWRMITLLSLAALAVLATVLWILNAPPVNHWLGVHTGTLNDPGPYYAFWSGFGSDIAEFGIVGAVATGVFQLTRKYNCQEVGCWRVGNYPAAGGQFLLCYHHHPDFHGTRPTAAVIARLHGEHCERQAPGYQRRH